MNELLWCRIHLFFDEVYQPSSHVLLVAHIFGNHSENFVEVSMVRDVAI
jgi:hypothetical protein